MGSAQDMDSRLDEVTIAIREGISASAPANQPLVSTPPMILANILEENRLKRQWQIKWDTATKNPVNRLQRCIGIKLKLWKNAQWADTIESLNSEDHSLWKMTKRVIRIPDPNQLLQVAAGLAYSDSEKSEALEDN